MGDSLEMTVGRLLQDRQLTLAVAESCTGGLLGHRLTSIPGASAYFVGGVLAYANAVKVKQLGVNSDVLDAMGAVSPDVATQMAAGVAALMQADLGVAITGIAGPDGGTVEKPVGLVFVALATPNEGTIRRCEFSGDRQAIKQAASEAALELIAEYLLH